MFNEGEETMLHLISGSKDNVKELEPASFTHGSLLSSQMSFQRSSRVHGQSQGINAGIPGQWDWLCLTARFDRWSIQNPGSQDYPSAAFQLVR